MIFTKMKNTIREDYVSFEIAKLLKEKGFPQDTVSCNTCYKYNGNFCNNARSMSGVDREICYIAPTKYMAMKWLREVHNILIVVDRAESHYYWELEDNINGNDIDGCGECQTYEEAIEAAIKYCLENLI